MGTIVGTNCRSTSTPDKAFHRNKQHVALILALGGLYPARKVVQAALAPQDGVERRILDLGCGSGVWYGTHSANLNEAHSSRAIAMAKEFPHAQVLGGM